MTTRRELAALQRKVNRALPPINRPVKIFIREKAIDPNVKNDTPLDVYFNQEGEKVYFSDIEKMEKEGIECLLVVGVEAKREIYNLDLLTDTELAQLETILTKAAIKQ